MKAMWLQFLAVFLVCTAHAEIHTEKIEYTQGDKTFYGYMAWDTGVDGQRPGVIVVHEWWGLNDYAKKRARMLAGEGYVALALDMYGEGMVTEHPQEAGEWANEVGKDPAAARARFDAAYNLLKGHELTNPDKIAAFGYCFGGSVVLRMAMSGVDLDAVVSFHGGLPQEPASGEVTASMLICNGGADSFVTAEQIQTLKKNLADAGADWEFISYGGAKHSFTNPDADARGIPALAYNEKADHRSWTTALNFLSEAFE